MKMVSNDDCWTLYCLSLGPLGAPAVLATAVHCAALLGAVQSLQGEDCTDQEYRRLGDDDDDYAGRSSDDDDQQNNSNNNNNHNHNNNHNTTAGKKSHRLPLPLLLPLTLHLAVLARWTFFATGHRCDFGALQLSSGFVGADSFHFAWAGSLLAINTFGGEVCVLLTLLG